MKNILSQYEYDHESKVITYPLDTGGMLKIDMADEILYYHMISKVYEFEIEFKDDAGKDVWFKIGGEFYTALQVIQDAQSVHDMLKRETEAEDDNSPPCLQSDFI